MNTERHKVLYMFETLPPIGGFLRESQDLTSLFLKGRYPELRDIDTAAFIYQAQSRNGHAPELEKRRLEPETWLEDIERKHIVYMEVFWAKAVALRSSDLVEATILDKLRSLQTIYITVYVPAHFREHIPFDDFSWSLPVSSRDSNPYHAIARNLENLPDYVLVHNNGTLPDGNMLQIASRLKWLPEASMVLELHSGQKPDSAC